MSITGLRQGIATNLSTVPGLRTSWFVPDNPTPPIAVVIPSRVAYDMAFVRGADEFTFTVIVIAQRASERGAQNTLDQFCNSTGTYSVKRAIESDPSLGGIADDVRVTDLTDYGPLSVGETQYLSATFNVTVISAS